MYRNHHPIKNEEFSLQYLICVWIRFANSVQKLLKEPKMIQQEKPLN